MKFHCLTVMGLILNLIYFVDLGLDSKTLKHFFSILEEHF